MDPEPADQEKLLGRLADEVGARGLGSPAIFLLELYKPLLTLFHAAGQVSLPFLVPLFGLRGSRRLLELCESRDSLERLIVLIEQGEEARARARGSAR